MSSGNYYRPYDSESDTGSDTDAETESIISEASFSNVSPDFARFAQELLQPVSRGERVLDSNDQVNFTQNRDFSLFNNESDTILSGISTATLYVPDNSSNLLKFTTTQVTSIINLDSKDRDKRTYPQPTALQLRLPRVYKNIINFQVVQIKLLSAFYYFRAAKNNLTISINEQNRYLDSNNNVVTGSNITDSNYPKILNTITNTIREGSYDINTLINELTIQLNTPPLFYDFIGGFNQFVPLFASSGDLSVGFNLPGDYFYDILVKDYIVNPTIDQIVTKYFKTRLAGLTSYTIDNIKIAYYYPVLKEMLLDKLYTGTPIDFTNANSQFLLTGETPFTRCVYYFQGLADQYVLSVIQANIIILDSYRLAHTFRYTLINKYNVGYDTYNNHIHITTPSLNTSLLNLINSKQTSYYNQQFTQYGITSNEYDSLFTQNTLLLAVLTDMYNYLQSNFAVQFGVQYNSFTLDYFANMSNYIYLRSGLNANVSYNYDLNVITKNITPISNNIISYYQQPPIYDWPNLYSNSSANFSNGTNISNYTGNPYNLQTDVPEEYHNLIDLTDTIYNSRLLNHADTVVNIDPASYTVFKFKSAFRQTLQVETLPRPTKYRYPEYNALNYDLSHSTLFDNSYNFIFNSSNANLVNSNVTVVPLPGFGAITDSNFNIDFSNSYALWSNTYASISLTQPTDYYSFIPPLPDSLNSIAYKYNITLNISAYPLGTNFTSALDVFLYRDVGAFYADINEFRNEPPFNYISSNLIPVSSTQIDIPFPAYQVPTSNQVFYVIVRSEDVAPVTVNYVITPYFTSSNYTTLSNSLSGFNPNLNPQLQLTNFLYARSYDVDYLHLPSGSNLYQKNPVSNLLFPDISYNDVPMGYDSNGISTDLTHYIGYTRDQPLSNAIPTALLYVDPITQYIFRLQGGYNSTTQTYFYPNTSNKLFTPQSVSNYVPTVPIQRQFSQVHYYANSYLSNSSNQQPLESNFITSYSEPFNSNSFTNTLSGYSFDLSGNLQLANGIYGLSLIPGQGTWDIQKYMFKSVFSQSNWSQSNINNYSSDPNLRIQYLGIYYTCVVKNKDILSINLSNSIATLAFSGSSLFNSSNTDFGFGSEGGTYYEFTRDTTFRTGYYSYLYGFTENSNSITNDYNNGYTVLAFDSNKSVIPFIGITGSLVPYPYYSDAVASNAYLDSTTSPTGANLIVPKVKLLPDSNRGPPVGYNETQAQYQQSMPIGTTYQAYCSNIPLAQAQMYAYSNIGLNTDKIVMDISGFMLAYATDFRLYSYDSSSSRQFYLVNSFTPDEIFDNDVNISFVQVAASELKYAFLGLSNDAVNFYNKLVIKTYNPFTYTVETEHIIDFPIAFDTISVTSFTYNNFGGFTMAIRDITTSLNTFYSVASSNSTPEYDFFNGTGVLKTVGASSNLLLGAPENPSYSYFTTYQNPNEPMGAFYVSIYLDSLGYHDIYYIEPSTATPYVSDNQVTKNIGAFTSTSNIGFFEHNYPKITAIEFSGATYFNQLSITRNPIQEVVYGYKDSTRQQFYQLTTRTVTSLPYDYVQAVETSTYSFPTQVYEMEAGYSGALWFSDLSGQIYGNRFLSIDGIKNTLQYAWQLFYPTQRVVYNNISRQVNLMPDLSGLEYPELYHTQLFFYRDPTTYQEDLSQSNISPWGNESNYYISDTQFSGYNFNAYSTLIPLENKTTDYYLAVRNYSPTEKSQVYMRFSLPNRYDYGYANFQDISNEMVLVSTITNKFNPNYASNLNSFNSNFIFTSKVFGCNTIPGFYGATLSNVTGFGDFMRYYTTSYATYESNIQLIKTITSNVNTNISNFISYDLQYIIPQTATNRQNFTDSLLFSILWRTTLPPQFVNLDDNWGLGWNLGYDKADTPYDLIQTAQSFYKILDDYIVLRLNNEFDINRVDTSAKEDLSATLESTGSTKAYYGKLLLAPFGSYAQTMVMNPIAFNPPLGRLDKLSFTWFDTTNAVIDNDDCEWNAVVQIVENIDVVQTIFNPPILNPR